MTDVQRDIGRMEARQDASEERLERIEAKVDLLVEYMATAKGGAGMLFKVGSIAATLGAAAAEFVNWFHAK
jgi:hypothetical protein